MLTKQICLVLGAGASQPYGFPTGGELMQYIKGTQPDEWWPLAKAVTGFGLAEHAAFVSRLTVSGVSSIDKFIGGNPAADKYAKALIAHFIGRAEDSANALRAKLSVDWVNYLIDRIVGDSRKLNELKPKWPHVITFNYDRSFEELLLLRLEARFEDATPTLVSDLMKTWEIVHVHGSLGEHPALSVGGGGRLFVPTLDPTALQAAINRLVLVHDASAESPQFIRAQELIRGSDQVFFLGFAFDPINLARLLPDPLPNPMPTILATQRGDAISNGRKASLRGISFGGTKPECVDLLDEHAHGYSD